MSHQHQHVVITVWLISPSTWSSQYGSSAPARGHHLLTRILTHFHCLPLGPVTQAAPTPTHSLLLHTVVPPGPSCPQPRLPPVSPARSAESVLSTRTGSLNKSPHSAAENCSRNTKEQRLANSKPNTNLLPEQRSTVTKLQKPGTEEERGQGRGITAVHSMRPIAEKTH